MKKEKKAKSPYVRYMKAPYIYSEQYQKWRSAVRKGNDGDAAYWSHQHYNRFMLGKTSHEREAMAVAAQ